MPPLLFLLLAAAAAAAAASTHPGDLAALKLFHSTILPSSIPPWSCLASWNFSAADPCAIPRTSHFTCGLFCTTDSAYSAHPRARVLSLTLDPAGYSARRPLTPLSLPSSLLHLDLSSNSFPGPLPHPLPASLLSLSLSSSSISGHLPASFPTSLSSIDLSRNSLSGPLPSSLSSLLSLRTLDLSFNSISGPLPSVLPPNLTSLGLRSNLLSGQLSPSTFLPLRRLEVADLASNSFSGPFPFSFLRLPSLQQLNLSTNSLTRFHFPRTHHRGSSVVAVDLGFNKLSGYLPVELADLEELTALSLRHNQLMGSIPWQYYGAKKGRPFRRLFLDGNYLNGKVPVGFIVSGDLAGSFADNCLEGCSAEVALCGPAQKPADVCREVYGRGPSRASASGPKPVR